MAFTTSKVFAAMLLDALGNTAAYDLDADTLNAALYGDGATPDNTVAVANTVYNVDHSDWRHGRAGLRHQRVEQGPLLQLPRRLERCYRRYVDRRVERLGHLHPDGHLIIS